MSTDAKDTIYIDVDDEITTIIDKVRKSDHKVVALVLPKRAATLQSIVNMKLLKRTADESKKNIVLITSEAGLLPLAGNVGLHVAKTLQSKPEIPPGPENIGEGIVDDALEVESEPTDFNSEDAADKPVGDLASAALSATAFDDTIDLDEKDLSDEKEADDEKPSKKGKGGKGKKNSKLKIPNFLRFRKWLLIGAGIIILLIVLFLIFNTSLDKATITVDTSNSNINTNLTGTLSTTANLDTTKDIIPAVAQSTQKSQSQQVNATGQQNNGAKASGSVSMSAGSCTPTVPQDVPSGVGVTISSNTFITQQATSFAPVSNHGQCTYQSTGSTPVQAISGGTQFNNLNSSCSVPSMSNISCSVSATTSGGTDDIINIVSQADINNATAKLATVNTTTIKQQLQTALTQAGLEPISGSFAAGTPNTAVNPSLGTQSNTVTVTQTITYTMLGIHESDLQTLVNDSVNQQINGKQQSIVSNGARQAVFTVTNPSPTGANVVIAVNSVVGTKIDVNSIKSQIVGKKSADVQSIIKAYPGVTNVTVNFSPFWTDTVPTNQSKITLVIKNTG